MTDAAEGVPSGDRCDKHVFKTQLFNENLDAVDGSGLRHLIEDDPVELRTMLE